MDWRTQRHIEARYEDGTKVTVTVGVARAGDSFHPALRVGQQRPVFLPGPATASRLLSALRSALQEAGEASL